MFCYGMQLWFNIRSVKLLTKNETFDYNMYNEIFIRSSIHIYDKNIREELMHTSNLLVVALIVFNKVLMIYL